MYATKKPELGQKTTAALFAGTTAKDLVAAMDPASFKEPEQWLALLYLQAHDYVTREGNCITDHINENQRKKCSLSIKCEQVFKKEQCEFVETVAGTEKDDQGC